MGRLISVLVSREKEMVYGGISKFDSFEIPVPSCENIDDNAINNFLIDIRYFLAWLSGG